MSTLTVSNISNGSVTTTTANVVNGSAKAWAKFNGTNGTINASYNVSSITVNGTGDFTVNFSNALTDANYSIVANGQRSSDVNQLGICGNPNAYTPTSSAVRLVNRNTNNGSLEAAPAVYVAFFR